MQQQLTLKLLPSEAASPDMVKNQAALAAGVPPAKVTGYYVTRRSLDARGRQVWVLLTVRIFVEEPFTERPVAHLRLKEVSGAARRVIIVGTGPAGLFAALRLIEHGIQPVLLERGKDLRSRRRDLARLNKEGILNPESNYCFGEGGAGTYSDGKLYTRSNKRGNLTRILHIFTEFGAAENILYEAHPHIGTNKLPHIIGAMRERILACGGIIQFDKKVTGLMVEKETVKGVRTGDGDSFYGQAVILATGHSARDVFEFLHRENIYIECKPFALGVRIEHPQALIDSIRYHCTVRDAWLPPASYSLVEQVRRRGVFSFCMCPGGIIAPAATHAGELVVNGWSPSRRNNPFANSGMVVSVETKDMAAFAQKGPLAGMHFQKAVEEKAYSYGGGKFVAPAQRMADFTEQKISATLPGCSYLPGIRAAPLNEVLPDFIYRSLQQAFFDFGKKMPGYFTNEAVVVATESRTSSPVRIPRDAHTLEHPQLRGLYPCAEGAGYAGGIVSAAMDGEKVAEEISRSLGKGDDD